MCGMDGRGRGVKSALSKYLGGLGKKRDEERQSKEICVFVCGVCVYARVRRACTCVSVRQRLTWPFGVACVNSGPWAWVVETTRGARFSLPALLTQSCGPVSLTI